MVDVIIPMYKPDAKAVLLIKKLLQQTHQIHEIHIINTESKTFPKELESMSDRIRITNIKREEFDHGGTRDYGARQSDAEYVVFMTQDALPVNECLIKNLIAPFQDENVAITYGRQLPNPDCKVIEKYIRSFNYPDVSCEKSIQDLERMGIKTYFCSDVCAAYRKSTFEQLGGFEKKTIFNEDMIMAANTIQAGYKVFYAADAKVYHSHNYTCREQFHRNFDLAVSQAEHPEIFNQVKSESEGIRMVKDAARYLIKIKKPWLILSLVVSSGFKYMGYAMGKHYDQLPIGLLLRCTMNKEYWKTKKIR